MYLDNKIPLFLATFIAVIFCIIKGEFAMGVAYGVAGGTLLENMILRHLNNHARVKNSWKWRLFRELTTDEVYDLEERAKKADNDLRQTDLPEQDDSGASR